MRKTYRYRNLSFAVADEKDVNFTVELISDGNEAQTLVNVPGPNDPEIQNSGSANIGRGADLRNDTTICVTDVANLIPTEDEIRIGYKINGELILEHYNPKSEEERPLIILFIRFTRL
jgi:hypothetical protein